MTRVILSNTQGVTLPEAELVRQTEHNIEILFDGAETSNSFRVVDWTVTHMPAKKSRQFTVATSYPASHDSVIRVLAENVDIDGRSDFVWLDLANGDTLLGVFPSGTGYERSEGDRYTDYTKVEGDPKQVRRYVLSESEVEELLA